MEQNDIRRLTKLIYTIDNPNTNHAQGQGEGQRKPKFNVKGKLNNSATMGKRNEYICNRCKIKCERKIYGESNKHTHERQCTKKGQKTKETNDKNTEKMTKKNLETTDYNIFSVLSQKEPRHKTLTSKKPKAQKARVKGNKITKPLGNGPLKKMTQKSQQMVTHHLKKEERKKKE